MNRRDLLKLVAIHGVGAIAPCLGMRPILGIGKANAAETIQWGYSTENGPETWSQLSESYQTCSTGTTQSPIDLDTDKKTVQGQKQFPAQDPTLAPAPIFHYRPMDLTILNTGRTIQVKGDRHNFIELAGDRFTLQQLHFHHPSEHRLNGDRFPMEMHLVHKNEQGALAVLGLFLTEGTENDALKAVWDAMPRRTAKTVTSPGKRLDVEALLPRDRTFFRYRGSLTTPPCSEVVQWMIFKTPIELSTEQVAAFKAIFPLNARPVQPINNRWIVESTP